MKKTVVKENTIYFFLHLFIIFITLSFFNYIFRRIEPLVDAYKQETIFIINMFKSHGSTLLVSIFIFLFLFYSFLKVTGKLRFLFSLETTDRDIYEESLEAWKQKNYDVVYNNMNYLYEMSQKENINSVYTKTAKAILLYQKTDFSREDLTQEEVKSIVHAYLLTYEEKELYLNTTHLAYSFLHLSKVHTDINKKAVYHLICAYLFSRVDSVRHKSRVEVEIRIFNSYFEKDREEIQRLVPENIFIVLRNVQLTIAEEDFKERIIPFLYSIL